MLIIGLLLAALAAGTDPGAPATASPAAADDRFWDAQFLPGSSVNGPVSAIAISGDYIYLGGSFSSAGGIPTAGIARWSKVGGGWESLNGGVSGCSGPGCQPSVNAIVIQDGKVYIGGNFSQAGSAAAQNIAVWDEASSSWSALDVGLYGCGQPDCTSEVRALLFHGDSLYAGGKFSSAGASTSASNIARYSSGAWYPLGSGTDGSVHTLCSYGTKILAGGDFHSPGNYLAAYGNGIWAPVVGINNPVYAARSYGTGWLVGGAFTNASGSGADHIAQWDGWNSWAPLGAGVNGDVYTLDIWGGLTFAAGGFTATGSGGAAHIAGWDGSQWFALGSGTDAAVQAVAVDSSSVYAGGGFTQAGAKPSLFFGRWSRLKHLTFLPLGWR